MTELLLSSPETTAERVLRIRTLLGLRQRDLARLLGVGERTIMRWEAGHRVRKVYLDRLDDMLAIKEEHGDAQAAEQS